MQGEESLATLDGGRPRCPGRPAGSSAVAPTRPSTRLPRTPQERQESAAAAGCDLMVDADAGLLAAIQWQQGKKRIYKRELGGVSLRCVGRSKRRYSSTRSGLMGMTKTRGDSEQNPNHLSRPDAAAALCLSASTLRAWASKRRGPGFIKLGEGRSARVLYPAEEIAKFLSDPTGYEPPPSLARRRKKFDVPPSWRRRWAKAKKDRGRKR